MYEYKVLTMGVRELEKTLNRYAQEGWRLAAASPNMAMGTAMGVIVTLKREATE